MKNSILIFGFALFTTFTLTASAHAATYYVATNGSDSNFGTEAQPFGTIAKGMSVLRPGDTLYMRGGTYNEEIVDYRQTVPSGTSYSNAITIAGYPGETATLRYIDLQTSHYIIFKDFSIDNGHAHTGISLTFSASDGSPANSFIRFQNLNVTGWGDRGKGSRSTRIMSSLSTVLFTIAPLTQVYGTMVTISKGATTLSMAAKFII